MPYMYTDTPEVIVFLAPSDVVDQIVDWFGRDIGIEQVGERVRVTVRSSPTAMLFWAMQYADCVKIVSPQSLQRRVCDFLRQSMQLYEETFVVYQNKSIVKLFFKWGIEFDGGRRK